MNWQPNKNWQRGAVRPIDPAQIERITRDYGAGSVDEPDTPSSMLGAFLIATLIGWVMLGAVAVFAWTVMQ